MATSTNGGTKKDTSTTTHPTTKYLVGWPKKARSNKRSLQATPWLVLVDVRADQITVAMIGGFCTLVVALTLSERVHIQRTNSLFYASLNYPSVELIIFHLD
jgi:hypothetical protein